MCKKFLHNLDSDSDAKQDSYLMGSHDKVFSTLTEAQDECHKLPQRPESAANQSKIFFKLLG